MAGYNRSTAIPIASLLNSDDVSTESPPPAYSVIDHSKESRSSMATPTRGDHRRFEARPASPDWSDSDDDTELDTPPSTPPRRVHFPHDLSDGPVRQRLRDRNQEGTSRAVFDAILRSSPVSRQAHNTTSPSTGSGVRYELPAPASVELEAARYNLLVPDAVELEATPAIRSGDWRCLYCDRINEGKTNHCQGCDVARGAAVPYQSSRT